MTSGTEGFGRQRTAIQKEFGGDDDSKREFGWDGDSERGIWRGTAIQNVASSRKPGNVPAN